MGPQSQLWDRSGDSDQVRPGGLHGASGDSSQLSRSPHRKSGPALGQEGPSPPAAPGDGDHWSGRVWPRERESPKAVGISSQVPGASSVL